MLSALTLSSVVLDGARFNETIYTWMVVGLQDGGRLPDRQPHGDDDVRGDLRVTDGASTPSATWRRTTVYSRLYHLAVHRLLHAHAGHEQQHQLQLFFGWGSGGLPQVSICFVGFWFNKQSAIFANLKAFLVNRVGDFGFILGIGLNRRLCRQLQYGEIFKAKRGAGTGRPAAARHRHSS